MGLRSIANEFASYSRSRARDTLRPRPALAANAKFHGLHEGEDCFILGSGHSVMRQDLSKLRGKIVMTQNHFHVHPSIGEFDPTYHVVVPRYQSDAFDEDWAEWFGSMARGLPDDCVFFHGLNSRSFIESRGFFVGRRFYVDAVLNPLFARRAYVDLTRAIMAVPTVLTQCLAIALSMGFKNIYLVGFDLDQICLILRDRDNVRFYGNSPVTANSAERDYEDTASASGEGYYQRWMMWKQFRLYRQHAEANGTQICNLAPGGLLDSFVRRDYDEVVSA